MDILTFLLMVSCPKTQMINKSQLPWVKWDYNRMHYCQKKCKFEYTDAPCLKKFFKLDYQSYFCLCGEP